MIHILTILFTLVLFNACSFKSPPNKWQQQSATNFSSYTQNFLKDRNSLAKNDLKRAIKNAKVSANLVPLAKIYLGKCALDISVGSKNSCRDYQEIKTLLKNDKLDAYNAFLSLNYNHAQIELLPSQYQEFATALLQKKFHKANTSLISMKKTTSALLASALLKEHIEIKTIDYILNISSHYGYKKSVLYWLKSLKTLLKDKEQIKVIRKKIEILTSK